MKNNEIESLLVNVGQIINMMNSININKDVIAVHTAMLKEARIKLDKWKEKFQNEDYKAKLSPAEQKAILDNAQAMYQVHQELVKELDYLDMSKHTTFVTNAVNELTHGFLLLEWLSGEVGKSGRIILPKHIALRANTFDKGKYKNQIDSLYAELETISHDLYIDHIMGVPCAEDARPMLIPICDRLTVTACWLLKEKQRLTTEALPELRVIKLPKEIIPEIPAAPESLGDMPTTFTDKNGVTISKAPEVEPVHESKLTVVK
jgi:hypothetical protein